MASAPSQQLPSNLDEKSQDTPSEGSAAKSSYGQILKSSALVGGSSVINIAIGVIRTKVMAVLLGPAGVGLMGVYGSIIDMAVATVGMGVNSSGVRQIAESVGSGDTARIAQTAAVLRRTSIFLGLFGAVFLLGLSESISNLTFGNDQHAVAVALLSLAVLFRIVSDGQSALIQGMRRIGDLAKMNVWGGFFGTVVSIAIVYVYRTDGVAPSIVAGAVIGLGISWLYRRKIVISPSQSISTQVGHEQNALLKLGFAFMASGLMMMGSAYAIRIIISRQIGIEAAGIYQAAWALGGMYIGFILQAMGTDFYPRLTAVAGDNICCNRMVNEQAQISMLLAGPGILATLTFAPLFISLFYTPIFYPATEVLRWLCLGMALRIVSWPMGFIILAKGARGYFFWSELAWTLVYLGLVWISVGAFGLKGTGIAFFGSYIFHCLLIYLLVRNLTDFKWVSANRQIGFLFVSLMAIYFCGFYTLPETLAMVVGLGATLLSSVFSIRIFASLIAIGKLPRSMQRLLNFFRLSVFTRKAYATLESSAIRRECDTSNIDKQILSMNWVMLVYGISSGFFMWVNWYEAFYGWSAGVSVFLGGS